MIRKEASISEFFSLFHIADMDFKTAPEYSGAVFCIFVIWSFWGEDGKISVYMSNQGDTLFVWLDRRIVFSWGSEVTATGKDL